MDNELRTSAVRLNPKEQYRIRKDIIRLSKAGRRAAEIAQILDVSLWHVFNTRRAIKTAVTRPSRPNIAADVTAKSAFSPPSKSG
jgi:hypothetical protein